MRESRTPGTVERGAEQSPSLLRPPRDSFRWWHGSDIVLVMKSPEFLDVDPRLLHLPTTRPSGADPVKLQRQIAQYGSSTEGMPPIFVYRGSDGEFVIFDGVTRATRMAQFRPGDLVRVEVVGDLLVPCRHLPTVGERLP